jgi:MarR family transcriptional regulator, lower aerobic nicotinate degradation pathway regulator
MKKGKAQYMNSRSKLPGLLLPPLPDSPPLLFSFDAEIRELVIAKLINSGHRALRGIDQRLQALGLVLPQAPIMAILEAEGEQSQVALTKTSLINRSSMVMFIDELEAQKLVKRKSDPDDRRINLVSLTAKGKEVNEQIKAGYRLVETDVLAGLNQEERLTLLRLLNKLLTT